MGVFFIQSLLNWNMIWMIWSCSAGTCTTKKWCKHMENLGYAKNKEVISDLVSCHLWKTERWSLSRLYSLTTTFVFKPVVSNATRGWEFLSIVKLVTLTLNSSLKHRCKPYLLFMRVQWGHSNSELISFYSTYTQGWLSRALKCAWFDLWEGHKEKREDMQGPQRKIRGVKQNKNSHGAAMFGTALPCHPVQWVWGPFASHCVDPEEVYKSFPQFTLNITLDSGGRFFELMVSGQHQTLHMTAITGESLPGQHDKALLLTYFIESKLEIYVC